MADPYVDVGARHASPARLMNHWHGIQLISETGIHRVDDLAVAIERPGIVRMMAARAGQDQGHASAWVPQPAVPAGSDPGIEPAIAGGTAQFFHNGVVVVMCA